MEEDLTNTFEIENTETLIKNIKKKTSNFKKVKSNGVDKLDNDMSEKID